MAACDALVDGDYAGEPMLRLQGVASAFRKDAVATQVNGAMLWQGPHAGVLGFTRVPLAIEFPTFWLHVMAVPTPEVAFQVDAAEPVVSEAYLHIVRRTTGATPRADDFVATDYGHVLIYVDRDVAPDSLTASYLGGALPAGFHVMTRAETGELGPAQHRLVELCVAGAQDVTPERARVACTAQHLYQLAPAPSDLDTILHFHLESSSP